MIRAESYRPLGPRRAAYAALLFALTSHCSSSSSKPDAGAVDGGGTAAESDATPDAPTDGAMMLLDGASTLVRAPKVLVISMFGPEGAVWLTHLGLTQEIAIRGLSPDYPTVHCNSDDVCNVITGMGHANAAASVTAIAYSGAFDLRHTYFLIAGIAGIDPAQGTLGSAAWARYLVDYGIAWELDPREMPSGWPYGYFGIGTKGPTEKPPLDYRTEVFQVSEDLLAKAFALSKDVALDDSAEAQAFRAHYTYSPANEPPTVLQCDTMAGDTWYAGTLLGQRARDWTKILTDGNGVYCTTQQEDNATYEVLKRATAAGRLDVQRLAVLRSGSDFDRPYEGQTSADGLLNYGAQGGFLPAISNLFKAGGPLVAEIVAHWDQWQNGVPP
jgi:purine nucleoside permease